MQVSEIMNPRVMTTGPETTVQDAARKMVSYSIGSLVVVKSKKLVGIVTERDIMAKVVSKGRLPAKTLVREAMTREVIMVGPDLDVLEACEIMVEKGVKKLPVIEGNDLVGIITATDIVTSQPKLMEKLSELFLMPGRKKMAAG